MNDIRVLMILDGFAIGGTETYVLSLTKQMLKLGITVFVAGSPGLLESKFRMLSCEIYNYTEDKKFENWIRRNKINIIHAHQESIGIYVLKLSKKLNIPMIFSIHGTYYSDYVLKALVESSVKPTFISVSLPVARWTKEKGISSIYIPNGIDKDEFFVKDSELRNKLDIPGNSTVIVYASRLEYEKYDACKLLLKSCEKELLDKYPNLYVLVAGGGKKENKIKKIIRNKIKSKRIRYMGNQLDLTNLYATSNYVVGSGRVAIEAIFCEKPVIAIGAAGTFGLVKPENFEKAISYYFCDHKPYKPLDQKSVLKALKDALQTEEQIDNCKDIKQLALNHFELENVTRKIIALYKQQIAKVM